jgi:predicted PurR-regulated permease PerM
LIIILQKINYQDVINTFQKPLSSIENFLIQNIYPNRKTGFLLKELTEITTQFIKSLDFSHILQNILSVTGSVLVYASAVFFLTFMLLYEKNLLRKQFLRTIPNAYFEVIATALYKIEVLLRSYLLGLMMQVGIFFLVLAIGLSIFGVKYAFTIAIFVAFLNLIPYLGVGIGFVFASVVTLSTDTQEAHTLWDFGVALSHLLPAFVLAITLDSILVQPIIFSQSVKAHPLEIFGAVVAGATLGGGLGMLLAIPIYTIVKVGYTEWQEAHKKYKIFGKKEIL